MAENEKYLISEKELYWRGVKLVQPGETFLLFDTERKYTQLRYSDNGTFGGMKSSVRLETGFLGRLNVSITAAPYTKDRYTVITPFDRKQGYPLDKDDLSLHSRVAKMHKLRREQPDALEGLYLFVFVTYEDLITNGILQAHLQEHTEAETGGGGIDLDALLRPLYLTLKFPSGSAFSAKAAYNPQLRFLLFNTFFPADTGPLPKVGNPGLPTPKTTGNPTPRTQKIDRSEGFDILLPFDLTLLKTIQAAFFVLPGLD